MKISALIIFVLALTSVFAQLNQPEGVINGSLYQASVNTFTPTSYSICRFSGKRNRSIIRTLDHDLKGQMPLTPCSAFVGTTVTVGNNSFIVSEAIQASSTITPDFPYSSQYVLFTRTTVCSLGASKDGACA